MSLFEDKFNSDYFRAYTLGQSIVAFVENEDDIPFWKNAFNKGAKKLSTKFYAGVNGTEYGKQSVLKLKDGLGAYLIICVDSDLDYLKKNSTSDSKEINQNPYIFQTYAYSRENFSCYPDNLKSVVLKATLNDNCNLNFLTALLEFTKECPEELKKFKLLKEELYLFVNGHDLLDQKVLPFIKKLSEELRKEQRRTFELAFRNRKGLAQKLKEYSNHLAGNTVENLIKIIFDFEECNLFKKIIKDIENFYNSHKKK